MTERHTTLRRLSGLLLVIVFLLGYEPQGHSLVQRLLLPALGAVGAYLIVANALAVALAVALLAGIHSAPGVDDPLRGWVYPVLAGAAGAMVVAILGRRFAAYSRATRRARLDARNRRGTPNAQ